MRAHTRRQNAELTTRNDALINELETTRRQVRRRACATRARLPHSLLLARRRVQLARVKQKDERETSALNAMVERVEQNLLAATTRAQVRCAARALRRSVR